MATWQLRAVALLCHAWHWESSRNEDVHVPAHLSPCNLPPVLRPAPDHLSAGDHCRGPGLCLLPAGEGSDMDVQGHTAVSWTRVCRRRVYIGTQTPTPWVTHTQAGCACGDLHVHTNVGWEGQRHTGCSAEPGGVRPWGWGRGQAEGGPQGWPAGPLHPSCLPGGPGGGRGSGVPSLLPTLPTAIWVTPSHLAPTTIRPSQGPMPIP